MPSTPFRVAIVSGVNPGKWTRIWAERRPDTAIEVTVVAEAQQRSVLVEDQADVVFARLPIDREDLSVIRLYEETPVAIASREHPISVYDSVTLSDLADEKLLDPHAEHAIDLAVAGVGVLLVPQSIARLNARRDLVVRPVTDAAPTEVALAWLSERTTDDIDQFVGIVRGRTAASSRGPAAIRREEPRRRRRR